MSTNTETKSFEQWCVVEIMGHKKFAGLVTEQTIGGTSFVRIDVPELLSSDGEKVISERFTKLFGGGSIYCITPCTEETARAFAAGLRSEAFGLYDIPKIAAPVRRSFVDHDDDRYDDDDLEHL